MSEHAHNQSPYYPDIPYSNDEFEALPERNIDEARAAYTALANSENPKDRWWVAFCMGLLTKADHDFGLALWRDLMRDEDLDVMGAAYAHLTSHLEASSGSELEAELAENGLTCGDMVGLVSTHVYELMRRAESASGAGRSTVTEEPAPGEPS